jgi:Peptidase inhibitor family I36
MNQKWMRSALLGVLVAGAVAGATAPAASAAFADCPINQVCLFDGPNGTGEKSIQSVLVIPSPAQLQIKDLANSHFPSGASLDNRISSFYNNTGWCIQVWTEPNFSGVSGWGFGHQIVDLTLLDKIYDNNISSIRMVPNC